jgi:hypothetical protein
MLCDVLICSNIFSNLFALAALAINFDIDTRSISCRTSTISQGVRGGDGEASFEIPEMEGNWTFH